jgi:hypothetical protein
MIGLTGIRAYDKFFVILIENKLGSIDRGN